MVSRIEFFVDDETRKWEIVIAGFFDDSGKESETTNPYVCIAGYAASGRTWNYFNELWAEALFRNDISWIHMKDLMPMQGEYKQLKWDIKKRNEVLSEFTNIIKATALERMDCGKQLKKQGSTAKQFGECLTERN